MRILRPLVRLTAKITIHRHEVIPLRYVCGGNRFLHASELRYNCTHVESLEYAAAIGNLEHICVIFDWNEIPIITKPVLRNCHLRVLKYFFSMKYITFDQLFIDELLPRQQRRIYHAFGKETSIMRAVELGVPRIMRLWLAAQQSYHLHMNTFRMYAKQCKRYNFVKLLDALFKSLPKSC